MRSESKRKNQYVQNINSPHDLRPSDTAFRCLLFRLENVNELNLISTRGMNFIIKCWILSVEKLFFLIIMNILVFHIHQFYY